MGDYTPDSGSTDKGGVIAAGDTIVAIATPPGRGALGVVRASGPRVPAIAKALLGSVPPPRQAAFRRFRGAGSEIIDEGLAVIFKAPASFTGEDTLELHAHGSPVVLDRLVARISALGARPAGPGEFSRRAFLNGKYDLAQLEAVADLIDSADAAAARCAQRSVQGEFSLQVSEIGEAIARLQAQVEAALDFSDEDVTFVSHAEIGAVLGDISTRIARLQYRATQGARLFAGGEIVIAGRPNVGKSSLLNRLAGCDEAIVSATAGTTRDVLKRDVLIGRLPVRVLDTAGLRESADEIEQEGVQRARAACCNADLVLVVVDIREEVGAVEKALQAELEEKAVSWITVYNKQDLSEKAGSGRRWCVSAKTGAGVDALAAHIAACLSGVDIAADADDAIIARRRHLVALEEAAVAVRRATKHHAANAVELVAEELRRAQRALGAILGEHSTETLLGHIFSRFCIGK